MTNAVNLANAAPGLSGTGTNVTVAGDLTVSGGFVPSSAYAWRNRLINGGMVIDQRNAGASVTQTTSVVYTVDRWSCFGSAASKFTAQRNAGSVTPPSGFTNYLGVTSSSAYTVGASEFFFIQQVIEGFNTADLAWGTASAQTVTLSVWVRSSLTGTFGGTISNGATNRVYPFTYTISAANTWEFKTITVAGDTTGTWSTDNSGGVVVNFNMGAGASVSGTAGAWSGSTLRAPTGSTSVVGTNGATFYLTGVQLEVGSVATPFERRDYGRELIMCQRYYQKSYPIDTAPGDSSGLGLAGGTAMNNGTNNVGNNGLPIALRVNMRGTPTVTTYPAYGGAAGSVTIAKASTPQATYVGTADFASSTGFKVFSTASGSGGTAGTATELLFQYTASAEL